MNPKSKFKLMLFIVLPLIFTNCKKNEKGKYQANENPKISGLQRSANSGEFLYFNNFSSFYETLDLVKSLSENDLEN